MLGFTKQTDLGSKLLWSINTVDSMTRVVLFLFVCHGLTAPQWASASSLLRFKDHTQTHHTPWDSPGRVISPSQSPLPHNTKHSQQTDIHDSGGIRTRNPCTLAAADQLLRRRGRSAWLFRFITVPSVIGLLSVV
jgi:hypothetical protein